MLFAAAGLARSLHQIILVGSVGREGILLCFAQIVISSAASVPSELLLKGSAMSTDLLNVCIYGWGLVGLLAGASLTPGVGVYQIMKV